MATIGIRGFNPIWSMVDLAGVQFDDAFYMYTLQNTIPYLEQAVYHDEALTIPWTDPIQFLANGTLPVDIYFSPETIYRLEFRQNDGIDPPTQQDALIYVVENYVPGSGGSTPINDVSFTPDNQITNPQFPLISFVSPLVLTGLTNPDPIEVAPGWQLVLIGSGNATVTQVPLTSATGTTNPTNAPYALQITISGTWTTAYLRQRFDQSGNLWAGKFVSSSITARVEGAAAVIFATLVDSNGTNLGSVLGQTTLSDSFEEYTGVTPTALPVASNPNTPPAAWVEYRLSLPTAVDIYVTSFQLVPATNALSYVYEQETIQRQIDHTYHTAYPIMPVGGVINYDGFGIPEHYLLQNGAAYSRETYRQLFNVLTTTETVTLTSTVNTFTVVSSDEYRVGMAIEGNGIPASTTITTIVGTTITMSNPASITGSSLVRFFMHGAGDGSTTFNVFNAADQVIAGTGGSLFAGKPGAAGGEATHLMTEAELVAHVHAPLSGTNFVTLSGATGSTSGSNQGLISNATTGSTGGSTPFNIVQQTTLMKSCIRFE